jgi:hypothetical protein
LNIAVWPENEDCLIAHQETHGLNSYSGIDCSLKSSSGMPWLQSSEFGGMRTVDITESSVASPTDFSILLMTGLG